VGGVLGPPGPDPGGFDVGRNSGVAGWDRDVDGATAGLPFERSVRVPSVDVLADDLPGLAERPVADAGSPVWCLHGNGAMARRIQAVGGCVRIQQHLAGLV